MTRKRRKSQQQKQNRTLRTEKLEDRIVFCGCMDDVQYTGNNHLYVATDYDDQVEVDFTSHNAGTIKRTSTINGSPVVAQPVQFSYSNLTTIDSSEPYLVIKGLKGDDTITINDNGFTPPGPWFDMTPNQDKDWCAKYVAVYGDEGMDTIEGSRFGEHLSGGSGKDTILSGGTAWTTGNNVLSFDADSIYGGPGDDILTAGAGYATIVGGSGNDTIKGGWGGHFYGGAGNDTIKGGSSGSWIWGGSGNDTIVGGPGKDLIYGEAGDDKIYGRGWRDLLFGGSGNDSIWGGAGGDLIEGGFGNDTLRGGAGNDTLSGEQGKDRLNGGSGVDYLDGGKGRDQLWGGDDAVVDELWGQVGKDTFWQQTSVEDNLNDLITGIDDLKWHTGNKEPWA